MTPTSQNSEESFIHGSLSACMHAAQEEVRQDDLSLQGLQLVMQ